MTCQRFLALAALASLTPSLPAGEPEATADWFTPTLDARIRYEFRDVAPLDLSHAVTVRARPGLLTRQINGLSAFGELEATYALVDDYSSGATGTTPLAAARSPIADPENVEVNQAWIQYNDGGPFSAKIGRQRIIRNNAAFIGNVGWRQNEQTYDGVSLRHEANGVTVDYSYAMRANRIFGTDAVGFFKKMEGDFHFLDISGKINGATVGSYIYLLDVDPVTGTIPSTNVGESNTFGAWMKAHGLHTELAWQDGESTLVPGSGNYDALYAHVQYDVKAGGATYGIGLEYLGAHFKTPFATVHAFNGFADAFIAQRIGLDAANGYDGLTDVYLSYVRPNLPGGVTFKGFLHQFSEDDLGGTYGYETDAVFVKKFDENLTSILKLAAFFADDGAGGYEDIQQVSLGLNYSF